MNVLLLDNNDSFTFNIVEILRSFEDINFDVVKGLIDDLSIYDKIIFSPGPSLPKDFPMMFDILNRYAGDKDILGICLGHQAIAEFFGLKLKNLKRVVHGQTSKIKIINESQLYKNIPSSFDVCLYHSWYVKKAKNSFLNIDAVDTNGKIMSISHKEHNIFGVQYHPESFATEYGRQIIKNFLEL